MKKSKKQKPDLNEMAHSLTEEFFASEQTATALMEVLEKTQPKPIQIAYAALLLDRIFTTRIPDWVKARDFAIQSWRKLDKEGALPNISEVPEEDDENG